MKKYTQKLLRYRSSFVIVKILQKTKTFRKKSSFIYVTTLQHSGWWMIYVVLWIMDWNLPRGNVDVGLYPHKIYKIKQENQTNFIHQKLSGARKEPSRTLTLAIYLIVYAYNLVLPTYTWPPVTSCFESAWGYPHFLVFSYTFVHWPET